jgi:hypothetical protein
MEQSPMKDTIDSAEHSNNQINNTFMNKNNGEENKDIF